MVRNVTLAAALLASLAALVVSIVGRAEARHVAGRAMFSTVSVYEDSDWSAVREDLTTADVTTMLWASFEDEAMAVAGGCQVVCAPRFAATTDSVTIEPVFFDLDHTYIRTGDPLDFVPHASKTDEAGLKCSAKSEYWEGAGNGYVVFTVTAITGTVTIWAGTQ